MSFTAPVGRFAPNPYGLHDLGGNAWEWVEERTGSKGTLRGGGRGDARAEKIDLATRITHDCELRCHTFGFRLVLERKEAAVPSAR